MTPDLSYTTGREREERSARKINGINKKITKQGSAFPLFRCVYARQLASNFANSRSRAFGLSIYKERVPWTRNLGLQPQ